MLYFFKPKIIENSHKIHYKYFYHDGMNHDF